MTLAPYEIKQLKLAKRKFFENTDREDSGCLIWVGRVLPNNGVPAIYASAWSPVQKTYKRRTFIVPRFAYYLKHGVWPQRDMENMCGNKMCVEPEHWKVKEGGALRTNRVKSRRSDDPWLPVEPLVAYVSRLGGVHQGVRALRGMMTDEEGKVWKDRLTSISRHKRSRLSVIDYFCCEGLWMHPAEIYGELYWDVDKHPWNQGRREE